MLWRALPRFAQAALRPIIDPIRTGLGLGTQHLDTPLQPQAHPWISDYELHACFAATDQTHSTATTTPESTAHREPRPLRVLHGPFRGMAYRPVSWGSALPPKLLGSYEEPIHDWIEAAVAADYRAIANLGCAEGYYAVGFALRSPGTRVVAFDPVEPALEVAREIADLNGVSVDFRPERCTTETLQQLATPGTLLVVDIEGGEFELLDPAACAQLTRVDLIVEAHDCFRPGITDALIDRFWSTHSIEIRMDTPFRRGRYPLPASCPQGPEFVERLHDELRPAGMRWLRLLAHTEQTS